MELWHVIICDHTADNPHWYVGYHNISSHSTTTLQGVSHKGSSKSRPLHNMKRFSCCAGTKIVIKEHGVQLYQAGVVSHHRNF